MRSHLHTGRWLALGILGFLAAILSPALVAQAAPLASTGGSPERVGSVAFVDHLSNFPADFAVMREKKIPMLLFFHATYCGYCQQVDNNFLIPMRLDPEFQGRLLIRRVMIDSDRQYVGLDGKTHGYEHLAKILGVRGVPYILFLAPDGSRITSIQGTAYDYYGYYLSQDVNLATACAQHPDPTRCDGRKDGPGLTHP